MRTNALLFAFVAALAGLGVGCGEEEVPLFPSYSHDIKPLMGARCIRCHGAGGTLNVDVDSVLKKNVGRTVTDGGVTSPAPPEPPKLADFTHLEDTPDGRKGLLFYTGVEGAASLRAYIKSGPMPPPPAPPLTSREYDMLMRWALNPNTN